MAIVRDHDEGDDKRGRVRIRSMGTLGSERMEISSCCRSPRRRRHCNKNNHPYVNHHRHRRASSSSSSIRRSRQRYAVPLWTALILLVMAATKDASYDQVEAFAPMRPRMAHLAVVSSPEPRRIRSTDICIHGRSLASKNTRLEWTRFRTSSFAAASTRLWDSDIAETHEVASLSPSSSTANVNFMTMHHHHHHQQQQPAINGFSKNESLEVNGSPGIVTFPTPTNLTLEGNNADNDDENDVPRPTANGGFTHTKSSRAKISAANKGKTPWNKGKARSEEVRARIAAGVRAKNRERFLQKLQDMGLTEDEYEAQKKEERRRKDAERRVRRTTNGGYTPTVETRAKISKILKEKHAKGQIKRSPVDLSKVRRGFTHSEETRKKISESLKKRWADDPEYRATIVSKTSDTNSQKDKRKRVSETLKRKWKDPKFRERMMEKIANRKVGRVSPEVSKTHRQKISEAMKRKWQEAEYRDKTLQAIKRATTSKSRSSSSDSSSSTQKKKKVKGKKSFTEAPEAVELELVEPLSMNDMTKRREAKNLKKAREKVKKERGGTKETVTARASFKMTKVNSGRPLPTHDDTSHLSKLQSATSSINGASPRAIDLPTPTTKNTLEANKKTETEEEVGSKKAIVKMKNKRKNRKQEKDGSVARLREERRDLFDLLYGDDHDVVRALEMEEFDDEDDDENSEALPSLRMRSIQGDEDLDAFDPYGLDDY